MLYPRQIILLQSFHAFRYHLPYYASERKTEATIKSGALSSTGLEQIHSLRADTMRDAESSPVLRVSLDSKTMSDLLQGFSPGCARVDRSLLPA